MHNGNTRGKKEKGAERLFKEIMAENKKSDDNLYFQKAQ